MSDNKPILRITRVDQDIVLEFDGDVSGATGSQHVFRLGLSSTLPDWARTLLFRAISKSLRDFMHEVRRQAYDDGWRDAKSRQRAKVRSFWSDFLHRDRSY